MGIYYEKQCYSDTGVTAVAEAGGYPELGPAMELAQDALDRSDEAVIGHHCHVTSVLASHWSPPSPRLSAGLGVASFTYLEVLVTTARARGRGVASGIVTEIQSEDNIVT